MLSRASRTHTGPTKMAVNRFPNIHWMSGWSRRFFLALMICSCAVHAAPNGTGSAKNEASGSQTSSAITKEERDQICASELDTPDLYFNTAKREDCSKAIEALVLQGLSKNDIVEYLRNSELKNHGVLTAIDVTGTYKATGKATVEKVMKALRTRKEFDHIRKSDLIKKLREFEDDQWWEKLLSNDFLKVFDTFEVLETVLYDQKEVKYATYMSFYHDYAQLRGFKTEKLCDTRSAMGLIVFLSTYNLYSTQELPLGEVENVFNIVCNRANGWTEANLLPVLRTYGLEDMSTVLLKVVFKRVGQVFPEVLTKPRNLPAGLDLCILFSEMRVCHSRRYSSSVDERTLTQCVDSVFEKTKQTMKKYADEENTQDLVKFVKDGFLPSGAMEKIKAALKSFYVQSVVTDREVQSIVDALIERRTQLRVNNKFWRLNEYVYNIVLAWKVNGYSFEDAVGAAAIFPGSLLPTENFYYMVSTYAGIKADNFTKNLTIESLVFVGNHLSKFKYDPYYVNYYNSIMVYIVELGKKNGFTRDLETTLVRYTESAGGSIVSLWQYLDFELTYKYINSWR